MVTTDTELRCVTRLAAGTLTVSTAAGECRQRCHTVFMVFSLPLALYMLMMTPTRRSPTALCDIFNQLARTHVVTHTGATSTQYDKAASTAAAVITRVSPTVWSTEVPTQISISGVQFGVRTAETTVPMRLTASAIGSVGAVSTSANSTCAASNFLCDLTNGSYANGLIVCTVPAGVGVGFQV